MFTSVSLLNCALGGKVVVVGNRQVGRVLETEDGRWVAISVDQGTLGLPVDSEFAAVHKVLDTALSLRRITSEICVDPAELEDTRPDRKRPQHG